MHRKTVLGIALIVLSKAVHTNGFAAWLKCYIDLTDAEEIIMNHRITPLENALHRVHIEVKRPDDDEWFDQIEYPAGQTTTVMARLKVPPELAETDVQYAMDVLTPGAAASFVRPKLCNGRRASATHYGASVVFEISGETTTVELVAGYATGHEAVSLTTTLILKQEAPEL